MQVCKTEDPEIAAEFLEKSHERQKKLSSIKITLESKASTYKQELNFVTRQRERLGADTELTSDPDSHVIVQGSEDEERKSMEVLVGDIEAFAEQNRQVEMAMQALTKQYLSWVVPLVALMVAASQDDE